MRVLITGASGFLGGHLVQGFLDRSHQVRALVRHTSKAGPLQKLGVEMVTGDLKDADSLQRAVDGMDVVVHVASTKAGVAQEYVEATVKGTEALLKAAEQAGVRRFIYISSIAVHRISRGSRRDPITEQTPYEDAPAFLSNYVRSKIDAERVALEFARLARMEVIVIRPGIMYGPGGPWEISRLGYSFGPARYVVIGGGHRPLPTCYVGNCAAAILKAAEQEGLSGEALNIVDDEPLSALEYLRYLKAEVQPRLRITRVPYVLVRSIAWFGELVGRILHLPCPIRSSHVMACHLGRPYSNEKAKRLLGWRPETGKEEALAATMCFHAERARLSRRADLAALRASGDPERPLTACIVGCGMIAQEHLRILKRMPNAMVAGVCDANMEAARALADRFGVPNVYADAGQMLDAQKPSVLHILTPPQSHAQFVQVAAERRCNVFVEKPMAVTAAEARRMAADVARNGVHLCMGHNKLYDPVVVRARQLVESGAVGEVLWVESYCGFDLGNNLDSRYMVPGGEQQWTFHIPGGLYQNLAPHPLCLAMELLGKPQRVSAVARYGKVLPHAPTDELRIILETPGPCGVVTVSIAASPRLEYLRIYGTRMIVLADILNQWLIPDGTMRGVPKPISRAIMNLRHGSAVLCGTLGGTYKVLRKRWTPYEGMDLLIREFYAALQEGREPPVTAEEGVQVMEVMDEVWRLIGPEALSWGVAAGPES